VVRYADDIVVGFEFKDDSERFWSELRERMQKFQLELHPDKARLIEFGRHAAANRRRAGLGKPETFDFLGFRHICGKTKKGKFMVLRQTVRKRMQATLQRVKMELRQRMHDPVPEVGEWLKFVVGGHIRYFGVPGNWHALAHFRLTVSRLWHHALTRRSQRGASRGSGRNGPADDGFLRPISAILILRAVCASSPKARAGCGKSARPDPCGGYLLRNYNGVIQSMANECGASIACSRDDDRDGIGSGRCRVRPMASAAGQTHEKVSETNNRERD
jgi:hypothetical protein